MRNERWQDKGRPGRHIPAILAMLVTASPAFSPFSGGGAVDAPAARRGSVSQDTAAADTTITIRSTGTNLEFIPSRISAKQGTRLRIRFVNEGTLPHNIVLVQDENDIDMLGIAAFDARETEYVPLEHEERMIAYSDLAAPGETAEMTFEVPPAGEYWFVCLYSGHYNMMVGRLRSLK